MWSISYLSTFFAAVAGCGIPHELERRDLVKTAITNVYVWDGNKFPETKSTVIFINGRLANAPILGAQVIDGKGGYLLPGFIDAHCHITSCSYLDAMRQYGVTTALDMGTYPPSSVNACKAAGVTDTRTSGAAATVNGTLISQIAGFPADSFVPNPAAGRQFVKNRIAQGADYIKVFLDPLGPDVETLTAIVQAARDAGKKVITHAAAYNEYSTAEAGKADFPTHVPLDKALDATSVSRLVAAKQASIPTLIMMQSIVNNTHAPYPAYSSNAQGSVSNMYNTQVPILVGTDANLNPFVPANPPFGISLHQELQLLVQAGLSTVDAIKGATSITASKFQLYDRGSILPGLRADLVLLKANPITDIRNSLSVQRVWLNGVEFAPSF